MPEDISVQMLSQTSENIQKLYDLSTRIDERVKAIQENQKALEGNLSDVQRIHTEVMQRIAVLESKNGNSLGLKLTDLEKDFNDLDKRLIAVEASSGQSKDRWNRIVTFIIQIVWVILAGYLLMKLGIQAPAVP